MLPSARGDAVDVRDRCRARDASRRGRWSPNSFAVEGGLAADVGVGARVDVGEQVVERLADGVGQHQRAGHEGDAEQDGELVVRSRSLRAERFLRVVRNMAITPRSCFMRSSTRSGVGADISSTIRPSARKTTRSA